MFAQMTPQQLEEDEIRANEWYKLVVAPKLRPEHKGKFVAVSVESGDFELDSNAIDASDRLYLRRPSERQWLKRVGYATTYQLGGHDLEGDS